MRQNSTKNDALLTDTLDPRPKSEPDSEQELALLEPKSAVPETKWRVCIFSYNRLLRDTLAKLLSKRSELQVVGRSAATADAVHELADSAPHVLLLNSGGHLNNDLFIVRMVRTQAPEVRIMMLGMNDDAREFLQCIRAGVAAYVLRDASSQRVLEAVQVVCQGGAFCDGHLCQLLFNYFEKNANSLPSSIVRESLGLTQREQQLVPLLARGASNKEIADQFCLSEQTVKNHLYRMKQKVGAANRLGIVHLCRTHGLNV